MTNMSIQEEKKRSLLTIHFLIMVHIIFSMQNVTDITKSEIFKCFCLATKCVTMQLLVTVVEQ